MSDVVLTAALRSNLLNLQETQSLIDVTQQRLASGKKVSSALDNPQSYFAAKSLSDRASDLTSLLDGIGQSISTIKAADEGLTGLEALLDQADSLVDEARSTTADGGSAVLTGNTTFDGAKNMDSYSNISAGDIIRFNLNDENGEKVVYDTSSGDGTGVNGAAEMQITISANETVDEIIAQINAIEDSDNNAVLSASLNEDGNLEIKSLAGGNMRVGFSATTLDDGLGFGDYKAEELEEADNVYAANAAAINVSKTAALESYSLYDSSGDVATRTTAIDALNFKDPGTGSLTSIAGSTTLAATDAILVGVNGETLTASHEAISDPTGGTIQDLVDHINTDSSTKDLIKASFDEDTGQISIRAISAEAKSVQIGLEATLNDGQKDLKLGFGVEDGISVTADADDAQRESRSYAFGGGAGQLAQLENDYNTVRDQISDIVKDSGYRGVNLLDGDNLTTYFNEDESSSLTVAGDDLTAGSNGLDITEANFGSTSSIATASNTIGDAKTTVRNFASSLSNSLAVLQNRETFTKNMVNTLTEGSDKLTLADQNEEGAKLLSLQTRQTLGTTSLALASQSQQSVLRLF